MSQPAVTVNDLHPAPYNPRTIAPTALDGLGHCVEFFGDLSGIVWNRRTGNLVTGHQRTEALKKRGATFVDDPPRWLIGDYVFAVRVVDWDIDTEAAANVAANNPAIQGTFDQAKLDALLADVKAWDGALFDATLMDSLMKQPPPADVVALAESTETTISHKIIIDCLGEIDQAALLERFDKEGLKCRALIV